MLNVNLQLSPGAQKLLKHDSSHKIEIILRNISKETGRELEKTMKIPGYAPRDTNNFAKNHHTITEGLQTFVINPTTVSNGQYLWRYIVGGHHVLTTNKSRKWWFWHLKNKLNNNYTRKTQGPPGYVPPNNYPTRALETITPKIPIIIRKELGRLL
jgi:hypothetical protein